MKSKMVIIDDGQMQWVADQRELRTALESLGWSEDGIRWTEPDRDISDEGDDDISDAPYTVLCARVSDRSDEVSEEDRKDLPFFTWRPDWNCWHLA